MTDPFSQADDFFGGGNPSISFKGESNKRVWKGGLITRIGEKQQQKDFKTKLPEFWDEAKTQPKWVLPVDVQTTERDAQDPHDDGMRSLWISGGIQRAIGAALKATRSKLRPGGTIYVMWADGAGEDGDPKQYEANYTPPTPGAAAADSMFAGDQAAPQQHQQQWGQAAPAAPVAQQWGQPPAPPTPLAQPQQWAQPPAAPPAQQWPAAAPPTAPVAPQPPVQQWAQPPAPPAAPPAQGGLWGQSAAQPPVQQWPAATQPPAPAAPPAAPVAPPAQQGYTQPPAPAGLDYAAIDAAYAHLSEEQRAAIKTSGMSPEQIVSVYGPPQQAAA